MYPIQSIERIPLLLFYALNSKINHNKRYLNKAYGNKLKLFFLQNYYKLGISVKFIKLINNIINN